MRNTPDEETTDWRAVCEKTARAVRREGRHCAFPTPINGKLLFRRSTNQSLLKTSHCRFQTRPPAGKPASTIRQKRTYCEQRTNSVHTALDVGRGRDWSRHLPNPG